MADFGLADLPRELPAGYGQQGMAALPSPDMLRRLMSENLLPSRGPPANFEQGVAPLADPAAMRQFDPAEFAMAIAGGPRLGRAYQAAPNSLMGFRRNGPNVSFEASNYPHIQYLEVTLDNGDKFVDSIKGMNKPHAIERAYRNWQATDIKPLSESEARKLEPSLFGRLPRPQLPMDTASRMNRATEQGYTIDAYKGMYPYDWRTVPERNWKGEIIAGADRVPRELTEINASKFSSAPNEGGGAGFFSNDPAVASRFAQAMGGSSVFPVKLKFENPKIIDAKGAHAADFQFGPGAGRLKLPTDSPHDGVILKNTKDEGDVYIPKNPSQIRSRFAAFDPANKDSGNLLGGLAGLLSGGAMLGQQER